MSDNIPFEIQEKIMQRLPIKSLLRFRSVCKSWNTLIYSSDFVAHYSSQHQHLLVRYEDGVTNEVKCVSIVDDDHTFPQHKVSVTIPQLLVNMLTSYKIIGSSHGFLCLVSGDQHKSVLCNPSTRKTVDVTVPNMPVDGDDIYRYKTVLGFGVCPEATDPKIVKITVDMDGENPWLVEVFSLSNRAWRGSFSSNLPHKTTRFSESRVVVDGILYWLANDRVDGEVESYNLIVSFDLTSEEFGEVNLPDRLAHPPSSLSLYEVKDSLGVVENGLEEHKLAYHVWKMEDGVPKTFEKLYTVGSNSPDVSIVCVRGFRKTGEPLIELLDDLGVTGLLAAYDPVSKSISNVGITGRQFSVYSYIETLLL